MEGEAPEGTIPLSDISSGCEVIGVSPTAAVNRIVLRNQLRCDPGGTEAEGILSYLIRSTCSDEAWQRVLNELQERGESTKKANEAHIFLRFEAIAMHGGECQPSVVAVWLPWGVVKA